MKPIGKWIKSAIRQVVDPDRDERIQELAASLYKGLQSAREKFSIKSFAQQVDCTEHDLELAKRKVYQTILARAWQDDKVTEAEQITINWVIDSLKIPKSEAKSVQLSVAQDRFAAALSRAMADGILNETEAQHLEGIARSIGFDLGQFVRTYFRSEGEDFLRNTFAICTEGGVFAEDAWARLLAATKRLGLSKTDLIQTVRPQAHRFVEHVLVDAKSDGQLSEREESVLLQLIQTLELPTESRQYFHSCITALRTIRNARQGKLPILSPPVNFSIRAGEIVHYHASANWRQKRILKSGEHWDDHVGILTITDNRLMFSSGTKSFDVRFNRIIGHAGKTGLIRLQRMEKPEAVLRINEDEPIAYAILEGALALANQTRRAQDGGQPTRHIPREVRQRVWQRCGGRCAECGAAQYLEFDHVIPVAKGGGNSDENVQLLCRGCNLKKSAFI